MKKILAILILLYSLFGLNTINALNCKYNENAWIANSLNNCVPDWAMETKQNKSILGWILSLASNQWYSIDNAKNKIVYVAGKLVILAWILAAGWIIYSWLVFVTGLWDQEKIKKAKQALQWSLIGFLVAIISQQIINATINLIYWISNN